ncbi:ADP-ribosylhydrolase ARH3-like [Diadema antillarum]|uniref:ADP-ribosylhydrolase ARH3-like n=2 Tax=Diadema antillarum TaxID=105358 RepID=UPI003A8A14C6
MLKMAAGNPSLRSRFQGCLVSAVAGDCLGAPYEVKGVPANTFQELVQFFQQIGTDITEKDYLCYTDDTAMARSVAQSLIDNRGKLNGSDLAKKFAAEYIQSPNRGYGADVISILKPLGEDLDDVYQPARTQFGGSGSYGNGGAMRVAPVGLCPADNFDQMIEAARQSAQLTHANAKGYNGAILQCLAVHLALHSDPSSFDANTFVDRLLEVMEKEEVVAVPPEAKVSRKGDGTPEQDEAKVYCQKLRLMKTLLKENADIKRIAAELGNEILAHKSVPAAVYSFLRCQKPVRGIDLSCALERTVMYAIALDGDTDTIGSMAGAIAGAFYGIESVPSGWLTVCEGADHAMAQASQLHDIFF